MIYPCVKLMANQIPAWVIWPCLKLFNQSDCSLTDLPLVIYHCSIFSVPCTNKYVAYRTLHNYNLFLCEVVDRMKFKLTGQLNQVYLWSVCGYFSILVSGKTWFTLAVNKKVCYSITPNKGRWLAMISCNMIGW